VAGRLGRGQARGEPAAFMKIVLRIASHINNVAVRISRLATKSTLARRLGYYSIFGSIRPCVEQLIASGDAYQAGQHSNPT
jgi:hypothetical protein